MQQNRLLLVEDDLGLAEYVKTYLENQGFSIAHEVRGDKALERIISNVPDLVILDIALPGMDGLSVCREAPNLVTARPFV